VIMPINSFSSGPSVLSFVCCHGNPVATTLRPEQLPLLTRSTLNPQQLGHTSHSPSVNRSNLPIINATQIRLRHHSSSSVSSVSRSSPRVQLLRELFTTSNTLQQRCLARVDNCPNFHACARLSTRGVERLVGDWIIGLTLEADCQLDQARSRIC
jgi:hypothetical protein